MTASKHPLYLEALPSAHDGEDLAGASRSLGADLRCSLPQSRSIEHLCECACGEEVVKTVSSAAAFMMPSEALGGADGTEWDPALTPPGN
jgi:hypothetical protein